MAKLSEQPLHRLHIMVDESDHEWLKETLGGNGEISHTFRQIIRRLRGLRAQFPHRSVMQILDQEEWTIGNPD